MLNYSMYLYIYRCDVVSCWSAKQPPLTAPNTLGLFKSPPTIMLDTYGGLVKWSDRFGAGRFLQCRLVPEQA